MLDNWELEHKLKNLEDRVEKLEKEKRLTLPPTNDKDKWVSKNPYFRTYIRGAGIC